jgi:hypothetical protein
MAALAAEWRPAWILWLLAKLLTIAGGYLVATGESDGHLLLLSLPTVVGVVLLLTPSLRRYAGWGVDAADSSSGER